MLSKRAGRHEGSVWFQRSRDMGFKLRPGTNGVKDFSNTGATISQIPRMENMRFHGKTDRSLG
jgi:hypothetical protein